MTPYISVSQAPDPITNIFNNLGSSPLLDLIIFIAFVILFFLIFREIVCWYFKINEGLDVLYKISEEVAQTNALLKALLRQSQGSSLDSEAHVESQALSLRNQPPPQKPVLPRKEDKPFVPIFFNWLVSHLEALGTFFKRQQVITWMLSIIIGACVISLIVYGWMLVPILMHH
jgi:hypothetical protein